MDLAKAPIESDLDPLAYPWSPPRDNGLMVPTNDHGYLPMTIMTGRRLGKARLLMSDGYHTKGLSSYLAAHAQTPMRGRHVVLAVGSNASPEVMRNKFRRRGFNTPLTLPFVRCRVSNLAVGYMPFVAPRGYVPATPIHAPGEQTVLWASWFDDDQLAALDSTEPEYSCTRLASADYPLVVDMPGGEPITSYYVYEADSGVIEIGGEPIRLGSQQDFYQAMAQVPQFADEFGRPTSEVLEWLKVPEHQDEFVARLAEAGLIGRRRLKGVDESDSPSRVTYSSSLGFVAPENIENAMRIQPTRDDIERNGENCILVHPSRATGFGSHAVLRPAPNLRLGRPGVLGKLIVSPDIDPDEIEVDQLLRDGLGLDLQEWVTIEPATVPDDPLADALVGRRYATVRVQAAEHSHGETDLTLLHPVIMTYLGLSDGDHVVYEGMPGPDGKVGVARMRVGMIPEDVLLRREALSEGGLDALYASPESALGVYPDLPMVLMDSATRTKLNLGPHRLAAVRVRPSRRHKLLAEVREATLVMAVAVLGLVTISNSVVVAIISAVLISLLAIGVGLLRVRSAIGTSAKQ